MQVLTAPTQNYIFGSLTYLTDNTLAGTLTLNITNSTGFEANDIIVIGTVGNEDAEIAYINAVTSTSLTLTHITKFYHAENAEVAVIRYDQLKFYRSDSKDGAYAHLSTEGSPVNITVDRPEGTRFEDSNGISSYWYKATYYNSVTTKESDIADSIPAQAGEPEHYTTIYRIKIQAGFVKNYYISSEIIEQYRQEAEETVNGYLVGIYDTPFIVVPRRITYVTTLLAAGYLLSQEYGMADDSDSNKNGQNMINRAITILEQLQDGKETLTVEGKSTNGDSSTIKVSSSNNFDASTRNKGELFTLEDSPFSFGDPSHGDGATYGSSPSVYRKWL